MRLNRRGAHTATVSTTSSKRDRQETNERTSVSLSVCPASSTACRRCGQVVTSSAVVPLVVEVVVEVADHVANGLLASLRVERVLDGLGCLDEVVDVDAGAVAEDTPEDARDAEEHRLREQYDRHPLIVADVTLHHAHLARYRRLVGQVVRARYPAHLADTPHNHR